MPDKDDETAALRAEIEELKAKVPSDGGGGAGDSPGRRKGWWRPVASGLILVLVVVLSPLCIVAAWAHREISQTDTYVSTVAPLASDPAIQAAISDRVTTEIFNYVDIPAVTTQAIDALAAQGLPAGAQAGLRALSVPLDSAIQNFVHERVDNLVRSPAFAAAWEAANREAHAQLVLALTGESNGALDVSGNTVSVNMATFIDAAKQQLIAQGFTVAERIPEVNASFVIFEAKNLEKAQRGFRLLDTISTVLPIITILLVVAAIFIARNRRKALIAGSLAVAGGMILLGLILAGIRPLYLNAIPADSIPSSAAAAVYDTLVHFIRINLRGVLLIALLIAFAAWVSGPSTAAIRLRRGSARAVSAVRDRRQSGFETGALGEFLGTYRTVVRVGLAALAALFLLFRDPVTGKDVVLTVLIGGIAWLAAELLAAPPADTAPPGDSVSD